MDWRTLLFTTGGRINRAKFIGAILVYACALFLFFFTAVVLLTTDWRNAPLFVYVCFGLLLSLSVLRRADNTVPVVVVTRDVVPGTRLRPEMVGTTRVHADERSLRNLVAADDRDRMIGSIVLSSLRTGDLLERSGGDLREVRGERLGLAGLQRDRCLRVGGRPGSHPSSLGSNM
jgi:hypothetical protein